MDISLRQLEALVCVIDNRSFSNAADALYLSQSTVSSHISCLEKALGQSLLQRSDKRRIEPTAAGWRVYGYAKDILKLCRNMELEFNRSDECPRITISASTVPSRYLVPELISSYAILNPNCSFSVFEGDSAFAVDRLVTGEVTAAFVGSRIRSDKLDYKVMCSDEIIIITPNNEEYRRKRDAGVTDRDLLRCPIILRESGSGTRNESDKYLRHIGMTPETLSVVAYMNDFEAVKKAVINGLGVTLISRRVADGSIRAGEVLGFPLDDTGFSRSLYLVTAKNRPLSREEKAFIAFARHYKPD